MFALCRHFSFQFLEPDRPILSQATLSSGTYQVRIDYERAPGGMIRITVLEGETPAEALELHLHWRDDAELIETIHRVATKEQAGFVTTLPLLDIDAWQLEIEVLVDDFTSVRFAGDVVVR